MASSSDSSALTRLSPPSHTPSIEPKKDAIEPAEDTMPTTGVADDPSRLKTFLQILRNFIGVADIATVRFSLPAQLLEPVPNLEYWNYLDRPEHFISLGRSDDELGRMLEVLRFWFTKDLKHVKGRPCKPYNSVLGEFFRCNWEVEDTELPISATAAATTESQTDGQGEKVRISYLTEQTSHHPPISAFYVDCPERGISARGFDQISAKFTGTSIRIAPGQHNLGIYINLQKRGDEEYRLTHPAAHVGGLLRGSLSITVSDTCYVTCAKTRIKAILQYLEDGWLSKATNRVVGVVFRYDPANDNKTKIKDVPKDDILAKLEGNWHEKIEYVLAGSTQRQPLVDIAPLFPASKVIPPAEIQLPNESRRLWSGVTEAILAKQYSLATKRKHELEESQRQKQAIRDEKNHEWKPRFFAASAASSGKPELTPAGEAALKRLHNGDFNLEESEF